jgi:hypothetical protein
MSWIGISSWRFHRNAAGADKNSPETTGFPKSSRHCDAWSITFSLISGRILFGFAANTESLMSSAEWRCSFPRDCQRDLRIFHLEPRKSLGSSLQTGYESTGTCKVPVFLRSLGRTRSRSEEHICNFSTYSDCGRTAFG